MTKTSVSAAHDRLAGYSLGAGLASGTDVWLNPLTSAITVVVTMDIDPLVANQAVDINIVYGGGDNTAFLAMAPGETRSEPRVGTVDTTTLVRSADGLTVTINSNNTSTGIAPGTTAVSS